MAILRKTFLTHTCTFSVMSPRGGEAGCVTLAVKPVLSGHLLKSVSGVGKMMSQYWQRQLFCSTTMGVLWAKTPISFKDDGRFLKSYGWLRRKIYQDIFYSGVS